MSSIPRRDFLKLSLGGLGLSVPSLLSATTAANAARARSCIVLYCWGGMSHHETWDTKPDAPAEYRGEFHPIATAVPGIRIGEHLPRLARHTDKLAIIRSMHHRSSAHGKGMYWNITGHPPLAPEVAANQPPSRADWPSLGAMVSRFRRAAAGFPAAVQIPYPLVDNNTLQAGDNAGFLGSAADPIIVRPDRGRPWGGVSRDLGAMVLQPSEGVDSRRLVARQSLVQAIDRPFNAAAPVRSYEHFRQMASDILLSPTVQAAFNLDRESVVTRDHYGQHLCGQSILLARRLTEAGVPIVTVVCAAGDLNGSSGDHWDTHGNNFNRLRRDLLPPFDRGVSALLEDLAERGRLDETLVVLLTDFGRTPRINGGAGRDHYPNAYSIFLAGGGIHGGQVYGSSDRLGAFPRDNPTGPADVHATIFHALGIPLDAHLHDATGRPFPLTDGRALPLF
ncbi:MAG: DUF1501 domain-containing protein [Planctomycetes bacterium]|nr:DUF1501 domain-containing protein [Planctomycetota bacterium]